METTIKTLNRASVTSLILTLWSVLILLLSNINKEKTVEGLNAASFLGLLGLIVVPLGVGIILGIMALVIKTETRGRWLGLVSILVGILLLLLRSSLVPLAISA